MNPIEDVFQKLTVTQSNDDDYTGEDGLLYCGKCHTPKQTRPRTFLSSVTVLFPLPVDADGNRRSRKKLSRSDDAIIIVW